MDKNIENKPLQNIYFEASQNILDNFYIILVKPKHPKNVGSSARAMMNMGFHNLIIAGAKNIITEESYILARTAKEVLNKAILTDTLEEAVKGMNYIVGTTRRPTRYKYNIEIPDELIPNLLNVARNNKVAILFGPEDTGLQIEHLTYCNELLRIPTSNEYPSINLSQAVLLVSYEIFKHTINSSEYEEAVVKKKATSEIVEGLFTHLEEFLTEIDYFPYKDKRHTLQLFRQIYRWCNLDDYDIGLLRSLIHKAMYRIKGSELLEAHETAASGTDREEAS